MQFARILWGTTSIIGQAESQSSSRPDAEDDRSLIAHSAVKWPNVGNRAHGVLYAILLIPYGTGFLFARLVVRIKTEELCEPGQDFTVGCIGAIDSIALGLMTWLASGLLLR
jgi:hypothetical protein